jgi:hypothetical protein
VCERGVALRRAPAGRQVANAVLSWRKVMFKELWLFMGD